MSLQKYNFLGNKKRFFTKICPHFVFFLYFCTKIQVEN